MLSPDRDEPCRLFAILFYPEVYFVMTNLRCNVIHCEYNNDNHCCRHDIQVSGGREATSSVQTCCESFRERSSNASNCASSHCRHPKTKLQIGCNAVSCRFNSAGICSAETVDISGTTARKTGDTECRTFVRGACPPCR